MVGTGAFPHSYNGGPRYRDLLSGDAEEWTSLIVYHRQYATYRERFETEITSHLLISVALDTPYPLHVQTDGVWRSWNSIQWTKGMGIIVPAGESVGLRIDPPGGKTLSIRLPDSTLSEVAYELPTRHLKLNGNIHSCITGDPLFAFSGESILRAYTAGAPNFYAQASANWLAAYMLLGSRKAPAWHQGLSRESISDYRLKRVLEYVEANVAGKLDLATLSKEAGISQFHFAVLFSKALGRTPHRYVQDFRLEVAKTMLASTHKTVFDIALSTGYISAAHFGNIFRRDCGQTPTQYRATHSGF